MSYRAVATCLAGVLTLLGIPRQPRCGAGAACSRTRQWKKDGRMIRVLHVVALSRIEGRRDDDMSNLYPAPPSIEQGEYSSISWF